LRLPADFLDAALLATSGLLAAPAAVAFVLDRVVGSFDPAVLVAGTALVLVASGVWIIRRRGAPPRAEPLRLVCAAAVLAVTLVAGLAPAWPALLPVSASVDEVNHFLLVDYLYGQSHLPRDLSPPEAANLGEMAGYPFAACLLVAEAARILGLPPYAPLHVVAAVVLAVTALFAYCLTVELLVGGRHGHVAALLVVPLLFWPAAYWLGQFTSDFFLTQMLGSLSVVGTWFWTARYRAGETAALGGLGFCGILLLFSYPTLGPAAAAGVLAPFWRRPVHLVAAAAPVAALALAYLPERAGLGLSVMRRGGVALEPSVETFPPLLGLLAVAGLVALTRRRPSLSVLPWALLAQTAVLQLLAPWLTSYAAKKMVYVLVPFAGILAALLLGRLLLLLWHAGVVRRAAGTSVAVALVLVVLPGALTAVTPHRSALTPDLLAAASWWRRGSGQERLMYIVPDQLTAYWFEIGLLKRSRADADLPRFHDRTRGTAAFWSWAGGAGTETHVLVVEALDRLLGPETDLLFRSGDVGLLRRRQIGATYEADGMVLLGLELSARRFVPGETGEVQVQLAVGEGSARPRAVVARLLDWNGERRGEAATVLEPAASGRWRSQLALPLDQTLPAGVYRVEVLFFRIPSWDVLPTRRLATDRQEPVLSAPFVVAPATALPGADTRPHHLLGTLFADGRIELVGNDGLRVTGRSVEVDLYWRARMPVDRDYSVFVHLTDGDGRPVAQADGYPWAGAYPTSAWEPAQLVRDSYHLALPAILPSGRYDLLAGMYRLDTMERVGPTASLGSVQVAESR
jgi:hypothetical protein